MTETEIQEAMNSFRRWNKSGYNNIVLAHQSTVWGWLFVVFAYSTFFITGPSIFVILYCLGGLGCAALRSLYLLGSRICERNCILISKQIGPDLSTDLICEWLDEQIKEIKSLNERNQK